MKLIKTTSLNAAHRALGAKMVDFSGWDMPLHYGSQLEEHRSVRRDAGMFDVSHMQVIDLRGAGVRDFLRRLLANDVAKLGRPGKALYSCMLNDTGDVLDDLIVYYLSGDWFRLVVNAGTADKDMAWIAAQRDRFALRFDLEPRRDLAIIAVQGPRAREKTWRALPQVRARSESLGYFHVAQEADIMLARTGYTGEDGFEVILPAEHAEQLWQALHCHGVAPTGLGARDTLRLEAGLNLYGQDMDETVSPLESALAWTVALTEARDFIGKAALLQKAVTRQLTGLVLLDKGVMRSHQHVRCGDGDGVITSGGFAPTLNRSIALARIPKAVANGGTVEVEVRDKWLRAEVVKPPFVRNGKVLISVEC
ncbi:MAG: glycine cleavage system aminomethyltransferase GcvT [Burkholderiales bacterium]|nr:glycine cleavage system aminomethyltransferase GcvT [Burkholderiales bacterium]